METTDMKKAMKQCLPFVRYRKNFQESTRCSGNLIILKGLVPCSPSTNVAKASPTNFQDTPKLMRYGCSCFAVLPPLHIQMSSNLAWGVLDTHRRDRLFSRCPRGHLPFESLAGDPLQVWLRSLWMPPDCGNQARGTMVRRHWQLGPGSGRVLVFVASDLLDVRAGASVVVVEPCMHGRPGCLRQAEVAVESAATDNNASAGLINPWLINTGVSPFSGDSSGYSPEHSPNDPPKAQSASVEDLGSIQHSNNPKSRFSSSSKGKGYPQNYTRKGRQKSTNW